ncbi:MAG: glycosyltransferase family 2 protein [Planctomycetaceae bacterium]|jgi:hypothetical protein|nr:glycosyltransferase family 2 protein [Planctomycetaceae bacterium]
MKHYLTLASMIRNEEHDVQEWLTFHYIQGFEQFVIVLHQCEDKTEEKIRALPFADKIRLHKVVSDTQYAQMSAFVWMAEHYGNSTEWMLFCDGDEFVFGTDTDDFREVLEKYEDYGGLLVSWFEYGHNNLRQQPKELCIEAFTKRMAVDEPRNLHASLAGKSIVKPRELLRPYAPTSELAPLGHSFLSPHMFKTAKPTVHTDFSPVSYRHWWNSDRHCSEVARCNHYRFRSLEDWLVKCKRSNCNDANADWSYDITQWEHNDFHTIEDTAAVRFASRIKEVLGR